jgi:hypothetical protein
MGSHRRGGARNPGSGHQKRPDSASYSELAVPMAQLALLLYSRSAYSALSMQSGFGSPSALRASFYVRTCGANNVVYVVATCKVDRGVTNCEKKNSPKNIYIYIFMRCGRDVYTLRAIGYYCISVQAG